jgi:serine/threonine protein kinase
MDLKELEKLISHGIQIQHWPGGATVVDIGDERVVKYGVRVSDVEVASAQLVRDKTSVPVPRILHFLPSDRGINYLVMEKLPGQRLSEILNSMDEATRSRIADQLKDYLTQLSQLDKLGRWSFVGRECYDGGMFFWPDRCKAKSLKDIVDYIAIKAKSSPPFYAKPIPDLLSSLQSRRTSIFSHGDLVPENILVDQDGNITGIIDWEFAGWYPHFWNWLIARRRLGQKYFLFWDEIVHSAMTNYEQEAIAFSALYDLAETFAS